MAGIIKRIIGGPEGGDLRSEIDADGIMHSRVSDEDVWQNMNLYEEETRGPSLREERAAAEVTWAPDHRSPDYAHLQSHGAAETSFTLKAEDLEMLADLNDFPVGENGNNRILFGLRGCKIVHASGRLEREVTLKDIRPNHCGALCVIGVWERTHGLIAAFPGSTVPYAVGVNNYYENVKRPCNILATGYYGYIVGSHVTAHSNVPGALLLRCEGGAKRKVVVRRTRNDLQYDLSDKVDVCEPGDNIHPSFRTHHNSFSSNGCQTVVGQFVDDHHNGPWADFRLAAGMTDDDGDPGKVYDYMLLTGLEAMRASHARSDERTDDPATRLALRRLRFGSSGEAVLRLQQALGLADPDGQLGANTARAIYVRQRGLWHGDSDGIYSPAMDAEIAGGVFGSDMITQGGRHVSAPPAVAASMLESTVGRGLRIAGSAEIDPSEFLGDDIDEAEDIRALPSTSDYESLGLAPQDVLERAGSKLWYPDATTSLRMPTRGEYAQAYPQGAVVHFTAGRCDKGDPHAEACIRYGAGERHAYFCISRSGRIYQTAPLNRWGSHAGRSEYPGLGHSLSSKLVGIEICDAGRVRETENGFEPWWNKPGSPNNDYYESAQVRHVSLGDNVTEAGHYQKYTTEQEEALLRLLHWLQQNNPDVFSYDYVVGHDEVAPKRKTDPGGALSMSMPELRTRLKALPPLA